ncbi:MAG: TRAP transporter large permease subunit, partial [Propionibacteriaceae bacterium]|nr:TRAP transporter large permease subunit [Propionibacteriaceae bacterium]
MSTETILLIVVAVFAVLLIIEVPIGYVLTLSGLLGITLTRGFQVGAASMGSSAFESVASYSLSIIPMYILVGMFAMQGKMAEHVFMVAERSIGKVRGGLGIATVAACAGFAAVTGSSVATAATLGRFAVNEMRKRGYPETIAAGVVAAGGTLGILIPPSIILAMYGILTGESIAMLLAAGVVPGFLSALILSLYIFIRYPEKSAKKAKIEAQARAIKAHLDQTYAATGETVGDDEQEVRWRDLPWRGPIKILVVFLLVMGGIYTGWFTV